MTYRSLIVEEHPTRKSAMVPYRSSTPKPADQDIFCSLNAYTWPTSLRAFADQYALPQDYVDNCWIRVAVDAKLFRTFLRSGSERDLEVPNLLRRVKDECWYVINEEEF